MMLPYRSLFALIIIPLVLCSGCIPESPLVGKLTRKSQTIFQLLIEERYDEFLEYFAPADDSTKAGLIQQAESLRSGLIEQFGTSIEVDHASYESYYSPRESIDVSQLYLRIGNSSAYTYISIQHDNLTDRFVEIGSPSDAVRNRPMLSVFYFFMGIGVLVLGFHIYTIRKIIRSRIRKKWLWILLVILLNLPAVGYVSSEQETVQNNYVLKLAVLSPFGIQLFISNLYNAVICIGIPIGSIAALLFIQKKGAYGPRPQWQKTVSKEPLEE